MTESTSIAAPDGHVRRQAFDSLRDRLEAHEPQVALDAIAKLEAQQDQFAAASARGRARLDEIDQRLARITESPAPAAVGDALLRGADPVEERGNATQLTEERSLLAGGLADLDQRALGVRSALERRHREALRPVGRLVDEIASTLEAEAREAVAALARVYADASALHHATGAFTCGKLAEAIGHGLAGIRGGQAGTPVRLLDDAPLPVSAAVEEALQPVADVLSRAGTWTPAQIHCPAATPKPRPIL